MPSQKPALYQESATIFPQPRVDIAEGIDIGAIGKAAYGLGAEIVDATTKYRFNKTQTALDSYTIASEAALKAFADNGQFDKYKQEQENYRKQVRELLGFDPEKDEPFGNQQQRLKASATKAIATFDNNLGVAQGEYEQLVELDTFESMANKLEVELQLQPTAEDRIRYINETMRPGIAGVFKTSFGSDIFTLDPKLPMSKQKRALARTIEAAWLKLQNEIDRSENEIANRKEDKIVFPELDTNQARNNIKIGRDNVSSASQALDLLRDALPGIKKDDIPLSSLPQDQQVAINSAGKSVASALNYYRRAVGDLLTQAWEINSGPMGPLLPFEDSPYAEVDPLSDEALTIIADSPGVKPEDMSELTQFRKELRDFEFSAMKSVVGVQTSILDAAIEKRKRIAQGLFEQTSARVALIDRDAAVNPEAATLERERISQEFEAQLTALLSNASPYSQSDFLANFRKKKITSSTDLIMAVRESVPPTFSLSVFGNLMDSRLDSTPRFREEFNTFLDFNMRLQKQIYGDQKATIGSALDATRRQSEKFLKDQEKRRRLLNIIAYEQGGTKETLEPEKVTQAEKREAAFLAIQMKLPAGSSLYDDNGNLKELSVISEELSRGNQSVPLPLSLLMETPYWQHMLSDVQNSKTPEDTLKRLFAPFISGPEGGGGISWDDIKRSNTYTLRSPDISDNASDAIMEGLKSSNPGRTQATMATFLMYPEDTRKQFLARLDTAIEAETDPLTKHSLSIRRARLTAFNNTYKNENPFEFVKNEINVIPDEQVVLYDRLKRTLTGLAGGRISEAQKEGIEKAISEGRATQKSEELAELQRLMPMFASVYENIQIGNGTELSDDGKTTVEDRFRKLLSDPSDEELLDRRTAASIVDQVILDEYFESRWAHPALDPNSDDFSDILTKRVNDKLSSFAWKTRVLDPNFGNTKASKPREKTTMPSHISTRGGVDGLFTTEQAVMSSNPLVMGFADDMTAKTVVGQFLPANAEATAAIKSMPNQHAALAAVAAASNIPPYVVGISRDSPAKMAYYLAEAALNGKTDAAAILAAQATLSMMPEVSSEDDARKKAASLGARIRSQILDGTLKMETEAHPSFMSEDSLVPTYVLYVNGKKVASMQPNSNSVTENLKDNPVYVERLKKTSSREISDIYNSDSFTADKEQDFSMPTKRDMLVKDWLMAQEEPNLLIRPYIHSDTATFSHNLWDEAWAFRKKTMPDGTVVVEKVKQIKQYKKEDGSFSSTPRWADYTEVYDPALYGGVERKRFRTSETSSRLKFVESPGLPLHRPVLLETRRPERYLDDPNIATGESLVYSPERLAEDEQNLLMLEEPSNVREIFVNTRGNRRYSSEFENLGKKDESINRLLNSDDTTLTVAEVSEDTRDFTRFVSTFVKFQDPLTKQLKIMRYTTMTAGPWKQSYDPIIVYSADE
jgi:hypothetical protein